jgi:hypothetical protein
MSREPETRPITAIFLGARIPFEHVGTVLRLLYSINADGFEIAPHFDEQLSLPTALPVLETLPLLNRSKAPRKPGSFVEFILKQLRHKPKSVAKLRAQALKAGKNIASLQPRLHDLHKRGLIKRLPDGTYVATGAAPAMSAPRSSRPRKSSAPSQVDLILSHLKAAYPRRVPRQALTQLLAAHGKRAASVNNSITQLQKKGLVTAAGHASYVYQPPKEPVDADTSVP